jgi:hypothetical protein
MPPRSGVFALRDLRSTCLPVFYLVPVPCFLEATGSGKSCLRPHHINAKGLTQNRHAVTHCGMSGRRRLAR